jgi:hypothetical protein
MYSVLTPTTLKTKVIIPPPLKTTGRKVSGIVFTGKNLKLDPDISKGL